MQFAFVNGVIANTNYAAVTHTFILILFVFIFAICHTPETHRDKHVLLAFTIVGDVPLYSYHLNWFDGCVESTGARCCVITGLEIYHCSFANLHARTFVPSVPFENA